MPVDRGIIAILYYNKITDIDKVEDFIGENNGYYEIKIDGKIEKLKIPDHSYIEKVDGMINMITEESKYEDDLSKELEKIKISVAKNKEDNNKITDNLKNSHRKTLSDNLEKRKKSIEDLIKREISLGIVKEPNQEKLKNTTETTSNIEEEKIEKVEKVEDKNVEKLKSNKESEINNDLNKEYTDVIDNKKDESNKDITKKNSSVITKIVKTETYFSSDSDKESRKDESAKEDSKKSSSSKSKKSEDDEYIDSI